jgi:hypothetical protein
MNDELERAWQEAVMILYWGDRENNEKPQTG